MVGKGTGDLVADHVAQHATKYPCDQPHQHGHQRRHLQQQGLVHTGGSKKPQADGVGPLDRAFGRAQMALAQEQHGQHAQGHHTPQHFDMPDPEKRSLVQQQVAQCAAAERRQKTDHADPNGIEALARGLIALLVRLFSGTTSDEIAAANLSIIEKLGFAKHLSMSRANGFASMIQMIKRLASQS